MLKCSIKLSRLPSADCLLCHVGSDASASSPYAEQIYGKTTSVYGIGRAGAKLRDIAMSEKKLNYFAKLIRRMHTEDALAQCKLQPKKAGAICAKACFKPPSN